MKKSIRSVFLAFLFLTVLLSGCVPASTSIPPTLTPIPFTFTPEPTATATSVPPTEAPTQIPATEAPIVSNGLKPENILLNEPAQLLEIGRKDLNKLVTRGLTYCSLDSNGVNYLAIPVIFHNSETTTTKPVNSDSKNVPSNKYSLSNLENYTDCSIVQSDLDNHSFADWVKQQSGDPNSAVVIGLVPYPKMLDNRVWDWIKVSETKGSEIDFIINSSWGGRGKADDPAVTAYFRAHPEVTTNIQNFANNAIPSPLHGAVLELVISQP